MYTVTFHSATIGVEDYLEGYVDIPGFRAACEKCPNYRSNWGCPDYDFDVIEYWKQFKTVELYAHKMVFDPEVVNRDYTPEELNEVIMKVFAQEKAVLSAFALEKEKDYPGSRSFAAGGGCMDCPGGCARVEGKPCRFPEKLRYSIEALGGNVGLTISKLMGLELEWVEEGKLPHHFVLLNGLLIP